MHVVMSTRQEEREKSDRVDDQEGVSMRVLCMNEYERGSIFTYVLEAPGKTPMSRVLDFSVVKAASSTSAAKVLRLGRTHKQCIQAAGRRKEGPGRR